MSYIYRTINGVKDYEHRHVMSTHIGRKLKRDEHIYHLNADPKDNRIENLIIVKKKIKLRNKKKVKV